MYKRQLIYLRYFEDKTQSEVADILGMNQVEVSRSERKTLKKMCIRDRYDPSLYISDCEIETFTVYVNKNDMKDYYVDIDCLLYTS